MHAGVPVVAVLGGDDPVASEVSEGGRVDGRLAAAGEIGAFDHLDRIDAKDHQLFLDLVGDASHEVRGLDLSTGDAVIRY